MEPTKPVLPVTSTFTRSPSSASGLVGRKKTRRELSHFMQRNAALPRARVDSL
jgi:hypothetical protein